MKKINLFLICYLSLFAFSTFSVYAANDQPQQQITSAAVTKSQRDNRQYKVIELPNKMRVLLVSDPKAVKSLGSLALPVGSLQDPKNQQGLAHYTEHMVLMGSKKYPKPADFSLFLNRHAGSYNASTAAYRTAFYFEVENSAFEPALDRLASAIAEPNLDPKFADKERNAVNAELTMARANDGFRIKQVDAETINQYHPASQFSGGNLQTLSDKKDNSGKIESKENSQLQKALINFHANYYSSNIMVGVLYSDKPLTQLVKLANQTFGKIPNHNIIAPKLSMPALTEDTLAKQITMIPAQPKKSLYLQFPIDNNLVKFADKSDEYIAYMVSYRSPNTLFDQLQKKGLIESISGNADPIRYGNSGVFTITASLTDKGLEQKDSVIAAIFNYLNLIKNRGIQNDYYQELKKVLALDFEYQSVERDMSYVEWLSDQMLLYRTENVLDSDYIATHFDKQAINARLQTLTIDNARIWTIAPNQATNKVAYFVDAPYQIENITSNQKAKWRKLEDQFTFNLPELNTYIPDDFSIVKQPVSSNLKQVTFNPRGNHIHFASRYFADDPKAAVAISFRNDNALSDVKSQVAFYLYDYIVGRNLAQLQFKASVAGISLSTSSDNGPMIVASGFSQHLPEMLMSVLKTYQKAEVNEQALRLAKAWYLELLSAADHVSSYRLAMQPFQALAYPPYFERDLKRKMVSEITVDDLITYRNQLFANAVPYLLTVGNISKPQSMSLYREIKNVLARNPNYNQYAQFFPKARIKITKNQTAVLTQQATSTDNALLMNYIPTGYDEISGQVLSGTLTKILSPWFYDQLRSNEQLGYAVFAMPAYLGQSVGMGFLIQSNQYDPNYLYQRYQDFYPVMLKKLHQLSDKDVEQYKKAVIAELTMPPQTLYDEFDNYMSDYQLSQFSFDSREKQIARAKKITKKELVDFYQNAVIKEQGLTFASQVLGQTDKNRVEGNAKQPQSIMTHYTPFDNVTQLQQLLIKLPLVKQPLNKQRTKERSQYKTEANTKT